MRRLFALCLRAMRNIEVWLLLILLVNIATCSHVSSVQALLDERLPPRQEGGP